MENHYSGSPHATRHWQRAEREPLRPQRFRRYWYPSTTATRCDSTRPATILISSSITFKAASASRLGRRLPHSSTRTATIGLAVSYEVFRRQQSRKAEPYLPARPHRSARSRIALADGRFGHQSIPFLAVTTCVPISGAAVRRGTHHSDCSAAL